MRTLEYTQRSWHYMKGFKTLEELKSSTHDEDTTLDSTRSLFWKAFLLFETLDTSQWAQTIRSSRDSYSFLRKSFFQALQNADEVDSLDDPLSQGTDSLWEVLRKDEALRQEIYQDVERCMPENLYFRQPATQNMLLDVLFTWAKLNPDLGYRQGMHELAAPVLWVIERDAIDVSQQDRTTTNGDDALVRLIFDSDFIEHDTFTLFSMIMTVAKSSFEYVVTGKSQKPIGDSIIERCDRILAVHIGIIDPQLAAHLQEISIIPQTFLLRWIRLLFGREFEFDHMLILWDRLFANDFSQETIDMICVIMILVLRWQLLEADYNNALQLLMKYPEPQSALEVATFVKDAIYLKTHLGPAHGHHIISRWTGRAPPVVERPETPLAPERSVSGNAISDAATPNRRVNRLPQLPGGLEGLLEDASRGMYTQGERWGLNQAVRGVVDEVKKNVQQVQTRAHSRMHSRTQSIGVDKSPQSPDAVRTSLEAIEARNQALARMLDGAVSTLWDAQRDDVLSSTSEERAVELTAAIAKVQFVQVYLADPSLALPIEQEPQTAVGTMGDVKDKHGTTSESSVGEPRPSNEVTIEEEPTKATIQSDAPPKKIRPPRSRPSTADVPLPPSSPPKPSRPPLEQSSFSWMLGQEEVQSSSARKAFMSGAPFREGSYRGKSSARSNNAYLFGEPQDDPLARTDSKTKDTAKQDELEKEKLFQLGTIRSRPSGT